MNEKQRKIEADNIHYFNTTHKERFRYKTDGFAWGLGIGLGIPALIVLIIRLINY